MSVEGNIVRYYTTEEIEFLKCYALGHSREEIYMEFNKRFQAPASKEQIVSCMKRNGIRTGRTGRFETGHSLNQTAVGSEKVWKVGERNYWGIKVAMPSNWMFKHVYIWEKENGKLSKDKIIIFLDGDSLNCQLDNLMAIEKRINVIMNKKKLPRSTKDETLASIQLARLIAGIADAQKEYEV